MSNKKIFLFCFSFYFTLGSSLFAAEEVYVNATRVQSSLKDVPLAVSVVRSEEIKNRQLLGLDESMARIPGLFFSNRYNYSRDLRLSIRGFGARSNFGIRGIKVFIDDIPSTAPDGQTALDDLDLSNIEKIEVIRGPASALYGASSGGVINIYTEDGGDNEFFEIGSMLGEYSFLREQIKVGGKKGKLSYLLNGSYLNYGGYRQHSDVKQGNLSGKFKYEFRDGSVGRLILRAVDSPEAEDSGGLNQTERALRRRSARQRNLDLDAGEEVADKKVGAIWEKTVGHHSLRLKNYYNWRDFDAKLPITPFIGAGIVKLDRFFFGGGFQYSNSAAFLGKANRLTVGVDVDSMEDDRRRFNNLSGTQGPLQFDQDEKANTVGIFLQEEFSLFEKMLLTGGLRYDHVKFEIEDKFLANGDQSETLKFNELNYSIGASYELLPSLNIYANRSTAFETPTFTEFANPSNNGSLGGFANVAAQRTEGYEVGIKGSLFDRVSYEIAFYDLDVEDEVTTVTNVGGRAFFNNADTERKGVELGFDASVLTGLDLLGTYTYSDLEFDRFVNVPNAVGSQLPGVPEHHAYLELDYKHPSGVFFKWDWSYIGSMYADNLNNVEVDNYNLSNIVLGYTKKIKQISISPRIGVNNLFKQDYNQEIRIQDATNRFFEPGPGRNFYGSINVRYEFSE